MKSRPISHHLWLLATVLMLLFIFVQSLLPPVVSGAQSGRVAALIGRIFGEESALGGFLITYVRKLAHLTEFAILGILLGRTLRHFYPTVTHIQMLARPFFGFAVGFLDESLQMLSGRGPMIADVWIDGCGFLIGYLLLSLCLYLHNRRQKKKQDTM